MAVTCGSRGTHLVPEFEIVALLGPRAWLVEGSPCQGRRTYVAFRPMGLTLIIPLRNSIKVPLAVSANKHSDLNDVAVVSYRLMGTSISAR